MAVDGVGSNFNIHFSSSVYVVVDTEIFDPILPMCDQSFSLLLSTDFSPNCQFHLLWKLFFFNRVDTIVNLVDIESSCGLWILFISSRTSAARKNARKSKLRKARKAARISYGQIES